MSGAVHANVWQRAEHCRGAVLLTLLALADEANDAGEVDTTIAVVARKARTTERHVRRILDQLGAMSGVSAVHTGGRVVARLGAFAAPAVVSVAEPETADILSGPDEMSTADEMSGHPVRSGRNVRPLSPPMSPPLVPSSLPPTPPNPAPSDPPPLSPPHSPKPKTNGVQVAAATAPAPGSQRETRWAQFYAAVGEAFGGIAVAKAGGAPLAWVGRLAGVAGRACADDPDEAEQLWRQFADSDAFRYSGNGGDATVLAFGKWIRTTRRTAAKEEPRWLVN